MGGASEDFSSSPEDVSPAIIDAWGVWSRDGAPALDKLLTALFEARTIRDPNLCAVVFDMVGLYLCRLGERFNADITIHEAHAIAMSEVMSRPAVGRIIESAMSGIVSNGVSEVVE